MCRALCASVALVHLNMDKDAHTENVTDTVTVFQLLSGQVETPTHTQLTHLSICHEAQKPNTRPLG